MTLFKPNISLHSTCVLALCVYTTFAQVQNSAKYRQMNLRSPNVRALAGIID